MAPSAAHRVEVQVAKSPAEFFAENQAIAGFDNMGKSLYTTLRELIENSLDACESVQILPDISVHVEEMTQKQFNGVWRLNSSTKLWFAYKKALLHRRPKEILVQCSAWDFHQWRAVHSSLLIFTVPTK